MLLLALSANQSKGSQDPPPAQPMSRWLHSHVDRCLHSKTGSDLEIIANTLMYGSFYFYIENTCRTHGLLNSPFVWRLSPSLKTHFQFVNNDNIIALLMQKQRWDPLTWQKKMEKVEECSSKTCLEHPTSEQAHWEWGRHLKQAAGDSWGWTRKSGIRGKGSLSENDKL